MDSLGDNLTGEFDREIDELIIEAKNDGKVKYEELVAMMTSQ